MIKSTFRTDIIKFQEMTKERLNEVMRGVAIEGLQDLHYESEGHIYTGWFRASWIVSVGSAKDMVYTYRTKGFTSGHAYKGNRPRYKVNKKTGRVLHDGERVTVSSGLMPKQRGLGTITIGDKIVFSNAVPYAERVSLQFGFHRQAMADLRHAIKGIIKLVAGGFRYGPLSSYRAP